MHAASISRAVLAALCLFTCNNLRASPSPDALAPSVLAAISRMDALPFVPYAVRVEEHANGKNLSFEVRAPGEYIRRHTLISSDGKPALPKDVAAFAKERDSSEPPGKAAKGQIRIEKLMDLIDEGSLRFEKMDGARAIFTFTHLQPFSEDVSIKLGGRLVYETDLGYVSHLELFSNAPFKPESKAKVRTFIFALDFSKVYGGGYVMPTAIHTHVAGTALFIISFDESAAILFSDYRKLDGEKP